MIFTPTSIHTIRLHRWAGQYPQKRLPPTAVAVIVITAVRNVIIINMGAATQIRYIFRSKVILFVFWYRSNELISLAMNIYNLNVRVILEQLA